MFMGFFVTNLLIPTDPDTLTINTPSGSWELGKSTKYDERKNAIQTQNMCADTYYIEGTFASLTVANAAFEELTPILLASTYLTGLSVTIRHSTEASEVTILNPTEHWPRDRSLPESTPIISNGAEFEQLVEAFVKSWPLQGKNEKALLLVHHWLDALSCWSMEDLYLSLTTLLQVIVATEMNRQGGKHLTYYDGVTDAAKSMGIRALGTDFKNMRNELVHDGQLIGNRFAGPDKVACATVISDVINWFDEYTHAALQLGLPKKTRWSPSDFHNLNAYSIY